MAHEAIKNLSAYVKYEDFLDLEQLAKDLEEDCVLKKAREGDYSLLVRLLFFTGARISEIVGVPRRVYTQCLFPGNRKRKGNCPKWSVAKDDRICIDEECRFFSTYIQKYHHGIRVKDIAFKDRLIAVYGKSVKTEELKPRTVVVDQKTLDKIQEHIKRYSLKPDDKIINLNENGAKVFINKLKKESKISWLSAHKFRHGHAIYCIQNGMDIRTLQLQLGHTDLATTAIYLQFAIDDRTKVYDKVFSAKPDYVKLQCPSCGFQYKIKKNGQINLEDKLKTVFD